MAVAAGNLPGIDAGSIDLTVEQNVLTVRAERVPVQADGAEMIVAERPYGTFTRQVAGGPPWPSARGVHGRQIAAL